ncbi:MAG: hypothetical protein [Caudoviricetes sp.]|nr:MAG: hypothetical protein [Caudoviricetes sp.]
MLKSENTKIKIEPILFWSTILFCVCLSLYYIIMPLSGKHDPAHIIVAYTADPDVTDDNEIKLGYPDHRFSITCTDTVTNQCSLEIENGKKHEVKTFPYVKQEWFTPDSKNRPWHTLDVILTLPSYNGNKDLRFTGDIKQNDHLVAVMAQNGWITVTK